MKPSIEEFVAGLPKAELHVHLEGCLTPDLAARLAHRNHIQLPDSVTKASTADGFAFHDLTSFLAVYYPAMEVLQTELDFHDLAMDYLDRAHRHNVRHCELFFDPQAHTSRGVPFAIVLHGYRSAAQQAQREYNMSVSLIMCFLRDLSAESAMATLDEAVPFKEHIIGVGLDSDERDNPPSKFADVFAKARQAGFQLTMHCDIDQPNSIEHIRQAIHEIGVDRIDHGTNIVESDALVQAALEKSIGLTCCPISNSIVTTDFKGKEIVQLLRKGIKVTLASDDPAYFKGYINDNVLKVATAMDVSREELVQLQRNAFEIAWLTDARRAELLKELTEYAAQQSVT